MVTSTQILMLSRRLITSCLWELDRSISSSTTPTSSTLVLAILPTCRSSEVTLSLAQSSLVPPSVGGTSAPRPASTPSPSTPTSCSPSLASSSAVSSAVSSAILDSVTDSAFTTRGLLSVSEEDTPSQWPLTNTIYGGSRASRLLTNSTSGHERQSTITDGCLQWKWGGQFEVIEQSWRLLNRNKGFIWESCSSAKERSPILS